MRLPVYYRKIQSVPWDKSPWFDGIVDWMRRRGVSELHDGPIRIVLGPEPRAEEPESTPPKHTDVDDLFAATGVLPARRKKAA